jgi:hypothetical protein
MKIYNTGLPKAQITVPNKETAMNGSWKRDMESLTLMLSIRIRIRFPGLCSRLVARTLSTNPIRLVMTHQYHVALIWLPSPNEIILTACHQHVQKRHVANLLSRSSMYVRMSNGNGRSGSWNSDRKPAKHSNYRMLTISTVGCQTYLRPDGWSEVD